MYSSSLKRRRSNEENDCADVRGSKTKRILNSLTFKLLKEPCSTRLLLERYSASLRVLESSVFRFGNTTIRVRYVYFPPHPLLIKILDDLNKSLRDMIVMPCK